ncbi:uracil-DNA glycosylase [Candidatus Oleimmundimicrobium sp.]|uniref:uracil-DNA glycosylase n=1 Tax=Candidatus Oleimmundimicrobium sp. TaxID=3060597 RepID=UPI002719BA15|nr:uracil-DNA glycosylase [Candidatus Oleimmundimicrobium sp.]MDO8886012.1 uracil-DNA glycosylase [Candidatus Oleimmundimicrobium sp.]
MAELLRAEALVRPPVVMAVVKLRKECFFSVETLAEFYEELKDCQRCSLGKTRTNIVFGAGNENADLVFVGEAPGCNEDIQGKPFVGAAGKLLDKLLDSIGLVRDQIYIANVLKCRPPKNRDPLPSEIETCKPFLLKQIEIIKPKVVCTLGRFATQVILDKNVPISKVRGKCFDGNGYYIFPIYHPAAALYQRTNLDKLKADFLILKELLSSKVDKLAQKEETTEQLMFF